MYFKKIIIKLIYNKFLLWKNLKQKKNLKYLKNKNTNNKNKSQNQCHFFVKKNSFNLVKYFFQINQ